MLVSATIHKLTDSSVRFADQRNTILWLDTERGSINLNLSPEVADRVVDLLTGEAPNPNLLEAKQKLDQARSGVWTEKHVSQAWIDSHCRSCLEPFDGDTVHEGPWPMGICDECQERAQGQSA